jgi:hypothetical protein
LTVGNETYNVLRVRHLKNYDLVAKLQQKFYDNGIHYLKKTKKHVETDAPLKIVKFFYLEEIDEGIYLDKREEFHAYIKVPRYMSWDEFEEVTQKVKYNWFESKFDAALGAFYHDRKLHEVVRIYSDKIGLNYLQQLRKLYLEKIK